MKELRKYNNDVVIEVDLTEPERCMIGLMPLQEGIFFSSIMVHPLMVTFPLTELNLCVRLSMITDIFSKRVIYLCGLST